MKKSIEAALIISAFAILTFLFFRDVISSGNVILYRDLGRYYYPLREYAANLIKLGQIPFWNPYLFCGNPFIASQQSAVFYPLSIIYLLGDFSKAFNNFIYLHFILAGSFMYLFVRDRRVSPTAAFIGALSFAFGGYMFAVVNVLSFFSSCVWLPAVLWSFFRALDGKGRAYVPLTSLLLVFMYLAGEPMVLYMTSAVLVLFGYKRPKVLISISALFILFSAYQLFPMLELFVRSDRINMNYLAAIKWSMAPHDLLNLIFPCMTDMEEAFKGYWEKQNWLLSYYIGLFPILMLPIAAAFLKNDKKRPILFILAAALVLSLGGHTPIYHILFRFVPGFRLFRYPVKYFLLAVFTLSWLSALAFDFYKRNIRHDARLAKRVKGYLYAAFVLSFITLFVDLFFGRCVTFLHDHLFINSEKALEKGNDLIPYLKVGLFTIRRSLIFFAVFSLALFAGAEKRVKTKFISVAIAALVFIDLYSASYDINYSYDAAAFKKPSPNISFLMADRSLFRVISSPYNMYLMDHPDKEKSRDILQTCKERLCSNRMMEYGIYDVGGYDGATRTRAFDINMFFTAAVKSPHETRLLDALNVKYIASPKELDIPGLKMVKKSEIANIYENLNCLPRAFLARTAIVIKDRRKILEKFVDKAWDPREEAILEEEVRPGLGSRHQSVGGQARVSGLGNTKAECVEITKYEPNEVEIQAVVSSPKFLVLSDSFYPGWKVTVDGRPEKIYAANYVMRAVRLEAGAHIVRFIYDPLSFKIGLSFTLLGIAAILIIVFTKGK